MLSKSIYIDLEVSHFFYMLAIYALAQIIGLVSFFAPAGIGVFESILMLGLEMIVPASFVLIIVVLTRLWRVTNELGIAVLVYLYDKFFQKNNI